MPEGLRIDILFSAQCTIDPGISLIPNIFYWNISPAFLFGEKYEYFLPSCANEREHVSIVCASNEF